MLNLNNPQPQAPGQGDDWLEHIPATYRGKVQVLAGTLPAYSYEGCKFTFIGTYTKCGYAWHVVVNQTGLSGLAYSLNAAFAKALAKCEQIIDDQINATPPEACDYAIPESYFLPF